MYIKRYDYQNSCVRVNRESVPKATAIFSIQSVIKYKLHKQHVSCLFRCFFLRKHIHYDNFHSSIRCLPLISVAVGWTLSQVPQGKRQCTPWTGGQVTLKKVMIPPSYIHPTLCAWMNGFKTPISGIFFSYIIFL